jgi:hypothetical protein
MQAAQTRPAVAGARYGDGTEDGFPRARMRALLRQGVAVGTDHGRSDLSRRTLIEMGLQQLPQDGATFVLDHLFQFAVRHALCGRGLQLQAQVIESFRRRQIC